MVESRSRGKLVLYGLLLLLLFFGLVRILSAGEGYFFQLEMLGLVVLLLLSMVGFVGYGKRWGESVFFGLFWLYLVNLVLIWYFEGELYVVLLLIALVGFVISIPQRKKQVVPAVEIIREDAPVKAAMGEPKHSVVMEGENKKATAKFTPGKYLASKQSNVYHEPRCDWAKKIQKSRQVWFASKEEAWEKGYKGHGCVV